LRVGQITPARRPARGRQAGQATPARDERYDRAVELEEHTLEDLTDTCEECGVPLTEAEQQAALESGGPALCAVHAAEAEPAIAGEDDLLAPES
jgi:hypothetical protein